MRVKILKSTSYNGRRLAAGAVLDIDTATAQRWVKLGIAEETGEDVTLPVYPTPPSWDTAEKLKQANPKKLPKGKGKSTKAGD